MKRFLTILVTALSIVLVFTSAKPKVALKEATFQTDIHCKNCAAKVEANLPFEKGVEDLKIDVPTKVVTIVFNPKKTDVTKLAEAIRKVGYKAELIAEKDK